MKYQNITETELDALLRGDYDSQSQIQTGIPGDSDSILKPLLGVSISQIWLGTFEKYPEQYLKFEVKDQNDIIYLLEGDCCSESWFADIFNFSHCLNSPILDARLLELKNNEVYNTDADNRGKQEYDQVYGFRLRSEKGCTAISFRNSSNGYYGGWMDLFLDELDSRVNWHLLLPDSTDVWQAD